MSRRIFVADHLTTEELDSLFTRESNGGLKRRLQVIYLAKKGWPSKRICEATSFGRDWVFVLVKKYNERGLDGLADLRKGNGGHRSILNAAQQEELKEMVASGDHPEGGPWNSRLVAEWITEQTGAKFDIKLGWAYLKRLGFTLQVPAKANIDADPDAQLEFKKGGSKPR
jgi:transposase